MKELKRPLAILLVCFLCAGILASCSCGGDCADDIASDKWPEVEGTVIYVDSAFKNGDGSKEAPFQNISEAQERIRKMKSDEGLPNGGVTVLVASGKYNVTNGIKFTSEDSGTEYSTIRYLSAEKGGAVLTGGVSLSARDFEPLSDDEKELLNDEAAKEAVLKVDLTKYGLIAEDIGELHRYGFAVKRDETSLGYSELFVDGERMTISRYPNITDSDPNLYTGASNGFDTFRIKGDGEAIKERGLKWNLDELWVFGYFKHLWADGAIEVKNVDLKNLVVSFEDPKMNYGIDSARPFYFFNVFAETDAPGEYYIDRENLVLYLYPTVDFTNSSITLSLLDDNIISGENLSYVVFDGFEVTGSRMSGFVLSGDHIIVKNCKIQSLGYDAINISGRDISIENNEICQVGGSAVVVSGGDATTLTSSNNLVYNNYIHHWAQVSRTYKSAVWISGGCGTTVSHNEIHDAPHQAITWVGPKHTIEYNEIYNVCLETSDCGAIYAGRAYNWYGGIIRYNYIHDVGSGSAYAQGIYLDDALSGQTVYGNVIANVTGYGIQVGGGRDNIIENNLLINTKKATIDYDDRARDGMISGKESWFYEYTVSMPKQLIKMQESKEWLDAFSGYGDIIPYTPDYKGDVDDPMLCCNPANNIIRMNVYYIVNNENNTCDRISQSVVDMSVVENNFTFVDLYCKQLPNYEKGDCTLSEDSEAYKLGFKKIPFGEIGRIAE